MPGNHTWGVETKHQPKVLPLPRRESASQSISIWRCPPNIGVPPGYPSNHSFLLRDLPCQRHKPSSCWGTPHGTHVEDTHPAIGKQWVLDPAGCAKDLSWDLVHLLLPRCRQAPRRFGYLVLVVYICVISILRLACANVGLCGACEKPAREWFRSIFQNINSVVESVYRQFWTWLRWGWGTKQWNAFNNLSVIKPAKRRSHRSCCLRDLMTLSSLSKKTQLGQHLQWHSMTTIHPSIHLSIHQKYLMCVGKTLQL